MPDLFADLIIAAGALVPPYRYPVVGGSGKEDAAIVVPVTGSLLIELGDLFLLETGDELLLE